MCWRVIHPRQQTCVPARRGKNYANSEIYVFVCFTTSSVRLSGKNLRRAVFCRCLSWEFLSSSSTISYDRNEIFKTHSPKPQILPRSFLFQPLCNCILERTARHFHVDFLIQLLVTHYCDLFGLDDCEFGILRTLCRETRQSGKAEFTAQLDLKRIINSA